MQRPLPVLKSYSDTNAFLAASGVSESHRSDGDDDADSSPEDDQDEEDGDVNDDALVGRGDDAKVHFVYFQAKSSRPSPSRLRSSPISSCVTAKHPWLRPMRPFVPAISSLT